MMKERQDAWTEENDLLLAETVLRHVREGSTQLNAFDEVGDVLNRTSAACGFRWNAVVRHDYEKALQLAKKQRKQRQRALGQHQPVKKKLLYTPPVPSIDTFEDPVEFSAIEQPVVRQIVAETTSPSSNMATIDHVISYLESMKGKAGSVSGLQRENERLKKENQEMIAANKELEMKVEQLEKQSKNIQEDYETLVKIMNRARKLVLFEEEERPATKFKMDRNGNLEKVAE
ncbi:RsfA family transcriptional regulator [Litchfieldia salsa]|uniref:Prespore-specific regulator n=1 Tax=Litchfieldia salsa TaxID=930152 RepID=A0A1H0U6N7_9BACI|nr:RsfA family transcriptional regulator [Litchfieldia salsa]SDP61952.1 prespore-specific regulator [Litchfieldia salsa]